MPRRSVGGYLKRYRLTIALSVFVVLSEAVLLSKFSIDRPDVGKASQCAGHEQQASRYIPALRPAWVPIRARILYALDVNLTFVDRYHDTLNVLSTLAVAVFTATLWLTTRGLYVSGEKQIALANRNAAAAEAAAIVASDSLELAKIALTGLDRPYVFLIIEDHTVPETLTFGDLIQRGDELTITYRYKNFGKSPALIRETAFITRLYRGHEPVGPIRSQSKNHSSQAKSRSWVIGGGEISHPVRQKIDVTADPRMIAFLKAKTGGAYIHPAELRDSTEQPHLAIHDRVRYEDTLGNKYVLYVSYLFNGSDFHLFHHEHLVHARDSRTGAET